LNLKHKNSDFISGWDSSDTEKEIKMKNAKSFEIQLKKRSKQKAGSSSSSKNGSLRLL
jgi:hypothetical protein